MPTASWVTSFFLKKKPRFSITWQSIRVPTGPVNWAGLATSVGDGRSSMQPLHRAAAAATRGPGRRSSNWSCASAGPGAALRNWGSGGSCRGGGRTTGCSRDRCRRPRGPVRGPAVRSPSTRSAASCPARRGSGRSSCPDRCGPGYRPVPQRSARGLCAGCVRWAFRPATDRAAARSLARSSRKSPCRSWAEAGWQITSSSRPPLSSRT